MMPTFEVTIQGKKYVVEIPNPGAMPLRVIVDGQAFDVEVSGRGTPAPSAPPPAAAPRRAPEPPAPLPEVKAVRPVVPAAVKSGNEITSPMPGTILSIDVRVGDAIEPGQVVCVLEAMKMKNSIRAGSPGTVSEILVSADQAVAYGALLVRLVAGS